MAPGTYRNAAVSPALRRLGGLCKRRTPVSRWACAGSRSLRERP